jgi:hypothetical protein
MSQGATVSHYEPGVTVSPGSEAKLGGYRCGLLMAYYQTRS